MRNKIKNELCDAAINRRPLPECVHRGLPLLRSVHQNGVLYCELINVLWCVLSGRLGVVTRERKSGEESELEE